MVLQSINHYLNVLTVYLLGYDSCNALDITCDNLILVSAMNMQTCNNLRTRKINCNYYH